MKIAIVFFSQTGVTKALVDAAADEIRKATQACLIYQVIGKQILEGRFVDHHLMAQLHKCDAIIFASPTYMGGVAAQFKAFADATSVFWSQQRWANKLAAGITCGTGLNGDQTVTLQYMATLAGQHGMIWVGIDATYHDDKKNVNRLGCHHGVAACSTDNIVDEKDLNTARYLARRIVAIGQAINHQVPL